MPKLPLLIGLILALIWIALIPNEPVSDQLIYDETARALAAGEGYVDESGHPTAYWAPGYSFYLALFYAISATYTAGYCGNLLAFLFLIAGVYHLGKELYSIKVGWIAALMTSLYPSFLFYTTILASEVFFSTLIVWALFFLHRKRTIFGGILMGLATLVRPQALILLFAIPKRFFLAALIVFLTCLPWSLRNLQEIGSFVFVSANFGTNLWIGNHPGASGGYTFDPVINELNLVERDHILGERALTFIKENPLEYISLMGKRTYITLKNESIAAVWNRIGIEKRFSLLPFKIVTNLAYYLVGVLFFFSLFRLKPDWFLLSVITLLALPFILIQAQDRFHLPLIPFCLIYIARL